MKVQLLRNASLRLTYAGHAFLIDPCLAAKHTRPSYAGISLNPTADLPCAPEEVFPGAEWVIISHLHSDHFDPPAEAMMPKGLPVLCQPCDAESLRAKGFTDVTPVEGTVRKGAVSITRTLCQHGSGAVLDDMGAASGFLLRAAGEPSVYWAGDTVWCDAVAAVLAEQKPDIAVVHASGATWGPGTLIVMDAEQVQRVCRACGTVIATHMEAYDHATVTRAGLRAAARAVGIGDNDLLIPADGETLVLDAPGRD